MSPLEMRFVPAPASLWRTFFDEVGPVVMLEAYGWTTPPERQRLGEQVFLFARQDPKGVREIVGWGSILPSPGHDGEWFTTLGVRPGYQRQGVRLQIREALTAYAFKRGATAVTLEVLLTNKDHLARCKREGKGKGAIWVPSGRVTLPKPGHCRFTHLAPRGLIG